MMKKRITAAVTAFATVFTAVPIMGAITVSAANEPVQMEYIDRGTVAIKTGASVYLSWRLLGTEEYDTAFDVYRGSEKIATVSDSTNYTDTTAGTSYTVVPEGADVSTGKAVSVKANSYFDIPIKLPEDETIVSPAGTAVGTFPFSVSDCSTADLDGDGEYEIITKMVSSEHDVGSPGDGVQSLSGTVRFNAYKLDGTRMWEQDINLGKNVYSSAHTVQFLAYDFNLDGKAEMICQTSLGSTDAKGNYVSHAAKTDTDIQKYTDEQNASAEYRGEWGPITQGEEFLTVFDGATGEAIDTIDFPTARVKDGSSFGDTSGNRSNRFIASVAYLDGQKPYAVYLRGYYFGRNGKQRCGISGTSFDGEKLSVDYQFDTEKGQPGYYEGAYQYVGNGNHNCAVADVDNDGKDEFITGALCMEVKDDNSFKPRWCTFMEHGDALHLGDYDPTHDGMEFFTVHEDGGPNTMSGKDVPINFGMTVIDADNGSIIKHWDSSKDNGRGIMANIGAGGYYQVTSANAGTYKADGGDSFTAGNYGMSMNFRVFWDGDTYDELLDGTSITNWNGRSMTSIFDASRQGCVKINGSKSNPSLQADILGDWREELIFPTNDRTALRVFMTTHETDHKLYTLMHDRAYRMQVSSEQTAYNQPPHIGYYISENNDDYDARKNAAFIKTVHDGKEEMRSAGTVTINFLDSNNQPIPGREPITVSVPIGMSYTAPAEYMADFGLDSSGKCWRYRSGNDPVTVGENDNVINLVFSWVESEISYAVNAVDENGNILKTLKSGRARPGAETVTFYGDYGIIKDGSYYVTQNNSVSFSPSANDNTGEIVYKRVAGSGAEWNFEDGDISAVKTSDYVQTKSAANDSNVLIPANGGRVFKMVTSTDAEKGGTKGAGTSTAHLALASIETSEYMTDAKKAAVNYDVYFPNTNGPRMTVNLLDALPPADNWASGWSRIGFNGKDGYSVDGKAHAECADNWVHGSFILDFETGNMNYTYSFTETGDVIASGTKKMTFTGDGAIKPALAAVNLLSWTQGTPAYMDNVSVIGYDESKPAPTLPPTLPPTAPPTEEPAKDVLEIASINGAEVSYSYTSDYVSDNLTIIAAVYGNDGVLKDVVMSDEIADNGTVTLNGAPISGDSVKLFVWDDVGGVMTPVINTPAQTTIE